MAEGSQLPQTALIARESDTGGICRKNEHGQTGRIAPSNQTQGLSICWRKLEAQATTACRINRVPWSLSPETGPGWLQAEFR